MENKYSESFKKILVGPHPYLEKLLIMKQETYQDFEKIKGGKQYLVNWVSTFNPFLGLYVATTRDHYFKLWSALDSKEVLKAVTLTALEEIIILNEGDLKRVIKWKKSFN